MAAPSTGPPAPPPPGPTVSTATPAPATPAPPRGLSGGAKAGIAIVIVVVLVLAVLAFGLVPGVSLFKSSSGSNGTSSSSASGHASGTAAAHGSGKLVAMFGVSTTFSFSFGYIKGSGSCAVSGGLASAADNFTVPAQSGSYSSGDATLWVFVYFNASTPSESIIAVVGSSPYFLGMISGSSCVSVSGLVPIPSNVADSASAAGAFDADAGSFLAAHSTANALYLLLVNNTSKAPEWIVAYTNCSYDQQTNMTLGGQDGDLALGLLNGTTTSVITTVFESDLNCTALNLSSASLYSTPASPAPGGGGGAAAGPSGLRAAGRDV